MLAKPDLVVGQNGQNISIVLKIYGKILETKYCNADIELKI